MDLLQAYLCDFDHVVTNDQVHTLHERTAGWLWTHVTAMVHAAAMAPVREHCRQEVRCQRRLQRAQERIRAAAGGVGVGGHGRDLMVNKSRHRRTESTCYRDVSMADFEQAFGQVVRQMQSS